MTRSRSFLGYFARYSLARQLYNLIIAPLFRRR